MNSTQSKNSNVASIIARRNDIRLVTSDSPWGKAESVTEIADGIYSYSTPAHGGYRLNRQRNATVSAILKKATCQQLGLRGWYEEDVDWAIVVYTFPECFGKQRYNQALKSLKTYHKEAWDQL
jgi:hypothetical protein